MLIPGTTTRAQPVLPFVCFETEVDYYYFANKFDGGFGSSTGAEVNANYSHPVASTATLASATRSAATSAVRVPALQLRTTSTRYLNGSKVDELVSILGVWAKGKTTYDQTTVNAVFSGELFDLPAGAVASAVGVEYRNYKIDDQPGADFADIWGSTAGRTKGDEGEGSVRRTGCAGLRGSSGHRVAVAERLGPRLQVRHVSGSDKVWKFGVNWQIIRPAPARHHRYLPVHRALRAVPGNQTGFQAQTAIDPCIRWAEGNNSNAAANCAAAGIPGDYTAGSSAPRLHSWRRRPSRRPRVRSIGLVFTPEFADLSVAIDC